MPESMFIRVVLPLPFSPSSERISPKQVIHDFPLPARPRRAAAAQNFRCPATRGKISRLFH
jgi:hypothetical protein